MANTALSGCKIEFKDNRVIKSASGNYAPRLLKQIEKQHSFSKAFNLPGISAPHILDVKYGSTVSFSMLHANGLEWKEYFENASIKEILKIKDILIFYLNFLKESSQNVCISAILVEKLESLYSNTEFKVFTKWLISECLKTKIFAPQSFCHGDLSFLNIIFTKNGLVFIDFLDSFFDSYIIDIIKLRQDLKFEFCLKHVNDESLKIKNIFQKLNKEFESSFITEIQSEAFQILEVLNFLRIEPYISKDKFNIVRDIIKTTNIYNKFLHDTKKKRPFRSRKMGTL